MLEPSGGFNKLTLSRGNVSPARSPDCRSRPRGGRTERNKGVEAPGSEAAGSQPARRTRAGEGRGRGRRAAAAAAATPGPSASGPTARRGLLVRGAAKVRTRSGGGKTGNPAAVGPNALNPTHLHRPGRPTVHSSKERNWVTGKPPLANPKAEGAGLALQISL